MTQEKSRIDSFDVFVGSSPLKSPSPKQLEKWNILVCSDLGYVSLQPAPVRISEWNEFMASRNIVLSGIVENRLSDDNKPLYIEFPVKSMKDLDTDGIIGNAAPFSAYSRTVFALQQLIDRKTNTTDAVTLIKKAGLPPAEEIRVAGLLASQPGAPGQKPKAKPRQDSSIDKILSMVDGTSSAGDGTSSAGDGPSSHVETVSAGGLHGITDALFKSVAETDKTTFDEASVNAYIEVCRKKLNDQIEALTKQPFFTCRKASWNCFMELAKVIGRNKEVCLSVVSAPRQDMEDAVASPKVLAACMENGFAPDIIVWDYETSFTNASMDAMTRVAKAAEQYKCMVIAPLSMEDPLFQNLSGRSSVTHLFEEVRFLPFKKLRTEPASRCLCLCGPDLSPVLTGKTAQGRCCWFVAIRWAEMLLGDNNPFAARDTKPSVESVFFQEDIFSSDVAPSVVQEAFGMGLTFFEQSFSKASLDKAVSVIGREQAADSYSSFLFNLVVNRMIRLAGIQLLAAESAQKSREDVATVLERFLLKELRAYGAVSAEGQVTARAASDGKIVVDVNSDVMVSGYPVRFTFSF
jgi:hypothetical protein